MGNKRTRMIIVLIISFFISSLIANKLFVAGTPVIDENSKLAIFSLPQTSVRTVAQVFSTNHQPQPTTTPVPPIYIPPTAVPKTTIVQPTVYIPAQPTIPVPTRPPLVLPTAGVTTIVLPTVVIRISPVETPDDMPLPTATNIPRPTSTSANHTNMTMAEWGQCLAANGMTIYTQPGCSACTQQKKELGDAAKYVPEISCPQKPEECSKVGVRSTPSWGKNGKIVIPGATSLDYIAQVSGCRLPN